MERPLPDRIEAGETLKGVLLCPFGRYASRDRKRVQVCDEAAFNKLAAAANADGAEILCDFEHKSEVDRIDSDTTAAAWISDLAVNKDGLIGDLKFTDVGAEAVSNRRLRFLSCVWTLDKGDRPARLKSVALTNTPNIPAEPVLNKAGPETANAADGGTTKGEPAMEKLKQILGLAPEASVEEVEAAVKGLKDRLDAAEAQARDAEAEEFAEANKAKAERYSTVPDYKELMTGFVADVRAKGATPIFATSIPHSGGFSEKDGVMSVRGSAAGIGPYVDATRELGAELNVPVLDLNRFACEDLPKRGLEKANRLYMRIKPGEYKNHPDGKGDGCHTRDTGAYYFATAAVRAAREQKLGVCALFKPFDEVKFTPIPWGGPGSDAQPMKDDFSKDEIAYANEEAANREAADGDWKREIMDLRRAAEGRGMGKDEAQRWAAAEYRRRHPKGR